MGMLVVTALVTFFVQRQELWSIGKKAAVKMAGTAVVDVLAPGLHYEEKENGKVVMQNNGGTDSPQPAGGTQNADNPQAADGAQNADN